MFFKLKKLCGGKVKKNVSLKNFSTIKIGGKASFVCYPNNEVEVVNLVNYLSTKKIKHYVLGAGSNVLINSKGFRGVIIKLDNLNKIWEHKTFVQVGAGAKLGAVANYFVNNAIIGLEQAVGIPGTIGGAVAMNAGAFDFEIKNLVLGVTAIVCGRVEYLTAEQCKFSYRQSVFDSDYVVLSVDLKKEVGDKIKLSKIMQNTICARSTLPKQPSLGSVFKREGDLVVSKLLDEMGFKGRRVGDAMVSLEHAGIIVNAKNATSDDVKNLINLIKQEVLDKKNKNLLEEIRYLN